MQGIAESAEKFLSTQLMLFDCSSKDVQQQQEEISVAFHPDFMVLIKQYDATSAKVVKAIAIVPDQRSLFAEPS